MFTVSWKKAAVLIQGEDWVGYPKLRYPRPDNTLTRTHILCFVEFVEYCVFLDLKVKLSF